MNEYDSNRILDLTKKINYKSTEYHAEANCYILTYQSCTKYISFKQKKYDSSTTSNTCWNFAKSGLSDLFNN